MRGEGCLKRRVAVWRRRGLGQDKEARGRGLKAGPHLQVPPAAKGQPSLRAKGCRAEPRGGGASPLRPGPGAATGSSSRALRARNYTPREGPRLWGGGSERSRRAPRPGAVIESSTSPPLSRRLTAHAAIHSFISPSLHLPTLLSMHVSDLSSVHPIIAPGITQTCQPWLSPLSPACQSCLSRSPCPPPHLCSPLRAPSVLPRGEERTHDLYHT